MSIKRNLFTSYSSQLYVAALSVLFVPLYISVLGFEAYGLIGFYVSLQVVLQILDLGFASAATKAVTVFRGKATPITEFLAVIRGMELVFWAGGFLVAIVCVMSSEWASHNWFDYKVLEEDDVYSALVMISLAATLRWVASFYRGVLIGFEQITFVSYVNTLTATIRFVLVIPVIYFVSSDVKLFFAIQIIAAVIEVILLLRKSQSTLPARQGKIVLSEKIIGVRKVLSFSLSVTVITIGWVIQRQYDKVFFSGQISLDEYGYFSLAIVAAGVLTYFNSGIYNVFLPRFSYLYSRLRLRELRLRFYVLTHYMLIALAPPATLLVLFPREVLFVWSGEYYPAVVVDLLSLYSLGNFFVPLLSLPYLLQFSASDFRPSMVANMAATLCMPVALYFMFDGFGVLSGGYIWVVSIFAQFSITSYLVNKYVFSFDFIVWFVRHVMPSVLVAFSAAFILSILNSKLFDQSDRISVLLYLIASGFCVLAGTVFLVRYNRKLVLPFMKRWVVRS